MYKVYLFTKQYELESVYCVEAKTQIRAIEKAIKEHTRNSHKHTINTIKVFEHEEVIIR